MKEKIEQMPHKDTVMKEVLIILIVAFSFLLPVKTWGFGDPAKDLSDSSMENLERNILRRIVFDMDFLVHTKLLSWEAIIEDIKRFEYMRTEKGVDKSPSEFYKDGGGNCEDFAIYLIARLLHLEIISGFIYLHSDSATDHIAVVASSSGNIIVLDQEVAKDLNRYSPYFHLPTYVEEMAFRTSKFSVYRLWWFFKRTENQPQPQKIKSGE